MTLTAEQIAEARSEGYSDAEILDHYAKTTGTDIAAARKEGYSNEEILSHLSGAEISPQQEAVVAEKSAISDPALSGALGAGAGAVYSAKTIPVKAAKALGNVVANRMTAPTPATPSPASYTTPAGINVEPTKGGFHPGAMGNAQFNIEQQQANKLLQNTPEGFEVKGTSRIMTPVGMQEPAAALGGAPSGTRGGSILAQKRAEGWPIVRETTQVAKKAAPVVGGALRNVVTSSPAAGAMAGYNLQDALNRYREGDVTGATIGGAGTAAALLPKMKGKAGLIKPVVGMGAAVVNKLRGEPDEKAEGGIVAPHLEHQQKMAAGGAVQKFDGGGKIGKVWNVGEKIFGKVLDKPIEGNKATRFSEALNDYIGQKLGITQSDNYGIHGDRMGGKQFPLAQRVLPQHAETGAVWMTDSKKHSNDIIKHAHDKDVPTIWTTYLGGPDQLKSNKSVTQQIYDAFLSGARTPEEIDAINNRIASVTKSVKGKPTKIFREPFDIRDKFATQELGMDTFERRGALASLLGTGEGTRKGKLYMGMPEYQDILKANRDEMAENIPTSSVGSRLFSVENRPSEYIHGLHPDYDWAVFGKDKGVSFGMVPQELAVPDFYNAYKQRFPKLEPHGNAWLGYNKNPQLITEPYLENLYKAGYAEGGRTKVNKLKPGLSMLPTAQRTDMRNIGQTVDEFANADAYNKAKMLYNSPVAQAALMGGSMVNPAMAVGVGGSEILKALESGDYGDAALYGGLSSLPFIGKGVQAAKKVPAMIRGIGQTPSMPTGMVPAMAGGGSTIKKMMNEVMQAYGPKAAKEIVPGAPHTYPPQATGPWMRDYQPAPRPAPEITYMGKATSNPYFSSPQAKQDILDAADRQRLQYLQRIADPNSPGNTLEDLMRMYPRYESWMR